CICQLILNILLLPSLSTHLPSVPSFSIKTSFSLAESLRLSDGQSRCDGHVEISLNGMWGRVLDDDWNIKDAHVVCRQLQCGTAKRAYYLPRSERGIGPVAGVAEDVGVICSGESLCEKNRMLSRVNSSQPCAVSQQIRLVNGTKRCAGRVELYHDGIWGTICDDNWDLSDANVICRQLGCGYAIKALDSAHYGEGSGQIWLDDVNCTGSESNIWACPSRVWGHHNCQHKEDAGVLCSGMFKEYLRIGEALLEQLVLSASMAHHHKGCTEVLILHSDMYTQKCMLRDLRDELEGCYIKRLWLHVVQKEVINCQVPDCLPVDKVSTKVTDTSLKKCVYLYLSLKQLDNKCNEIARIKQNKAMPIKKDTSPIALILYHHPDLQLLGSSSCREDLESLPSNREVLLSASSHS
uniref:SRCR domain-containing protein n=1 Tax=Meleagris gallopavo TaxID=9103 RepID=G1NN01_MELGA